MLIHLLVAVFLGLIAYVVATVVGAKHRPALAIGIIVGVLIYLGAFAL